MGNIKQTNIKNGTCWTFASTDKNKKVLEKKPHFGMAWKVRLKQKIS